MLVSGVQQSDSVTHMPIFILFFRFFSHIGYHRILSRVDHARTVLDIYFTYSGMCVHHKFSLHTPDINILATVSLFSMFRCPLLLCR